MLSFGMLLQGFGDTKKSYRKLSLCCPRKLLEQDGAWPLHGTVNAYYCMLPVLHTRLWKRHEFEYVNNNAGTERLPIVTHALCDFIYYFCCLVLSARARSACTKQRCTYTRNYMCTFSIWAALTHLFQRINCVCVDYHSGIQKQTIALCVLPQNVCLRGAF
jgi:hypothetical protein